MKPEHRGEGPRAFLQRRSDAYGQPLQKSIDGLDAARSEQAGVLRVQRRERGEVARGDEEQDDATRRSVLAHARHRRRRPSARAGKCRCAQQQIVGRCAQVSTRFRGRPEKHWNLAPPPAKMFERVQTVHRATAPARRDRFPRVSARVSPALRASPSRRGHRARTRTFQLVEHV